MNKVTRTVTYLEDAGHSWLSVSHADIKALGLQNKITQYSHVNGTRVYLEEDIDGDTFQLAARAAGWVVRVKSKRCDGTFSWVRNLPRYCAKYLAVPLKVNTVVELCDGRRARIDHGILKNRWVVVTLDGRRYSVPKSNPFRYMTPIEQGVGYSRPAKTDRHPQFSRPN